MRQRQRTHDDGDHGSNGPGGQGGNLDALRDAGHDLLAAGDEAISKGLSHGNSEAFLAATRQEGGQ